MEDIDKEIELAKLKLRILELEKELKEKDCNPVYVPYYPWYQDPYTWISTTGDSVQTDTITITL